MATSRLVESERPQTRAVVKYVGRSAYKVRQVCDLIRGKDAEEAQNILLLCNRGAAEEVGKLLNSAMANASHNQNIPGEELFVKEIFADEGPTMKRFKPRARGRASSIRKRMSHVTIVLERKDDAAIEFKASKEQGTGAANAREQRRRRAEASKAKQAEKAAAAEAVENEEIVEGDVVEEALKAKAAPKAKTTETEEKTPAKKPAAKKPAAKKTESQGAKDEQPREASGSASDSTMDTEKEGDK